MDYLLPALGIAGLLAQAGTLAVLLRKRQHDATARHALGQSLAAMAVAYARAQGGAPAQVRAHALGAFRLADERDGVRDYSEREAAVYVDAELAK